MRRFRTRSEAWRGTGLGLLRYAREALLPPLGIHRAEWANGAGGHAAAVAGMRLRPRDLLRIGQRVLDRGRVGDPPVVPQDWLAQSLTPRARIDDQLAYGLPGWIGRLPGSGRPWYSGNGNGGQRLFIAPSLGAVIPALCGDYNRPRHWKVPVGIVTRVVLASLR